MKLLETVIDDFNISEITANAIKDKGLGAVALINTLLDEKAMTLELLFEVKSSVDDPHHVDMKGKERKGLKYGYSVIIKFFNLKPEHIEGLKEGDEEALFDVIVDCDAKVHCDDPSFYWQSGHERNHKKKNARYDFQGTPGQGIWAERHAMAGGKDGSRLCKHLYAAREWLIDNTEKVAKVCKKDYEYRNGKSNKMPSTLTTPPKKEEPAKEEIPKDNRAVVGKSKPANQVKTEADAVKPTQEPEAAEEEVVESFHHLLSLLN